MFLLLDFLKILFLESLSSISTLHQIFSPHTMYAIVSCTYRLSSDNYSYKIFCIERKRHIFLVYNYILAHNNLLEKYYYSSNTSNTTAKVLMFNLFHNLIVALITKSFHAIPFFPQFALRATIFTNFATLVFVCFYDFIHIIS